MPPCVAYLVWEEKKADASVTAAHGTANTRYAKDRTKTFKSFFEFVESFWPSRRLLRFDCNTKESRTLVTAPEALITADEVLSGLEQYAQKKADEALQRFARVNDQTVRRLQSQQLAENCEREH